MKKLMILIISLGIFVSCEKEKFDLISGKTPAEQGEDPDLEGSVIKTEIAEFGYVTCDTVMSSLFGFPIKPVKPAIDFNRAMWQLGQQISGKLLTEQHRLLVAHMAGQVPHGIAPHDGYSSSDWETCSFQEKYTASENFQFSGACLDEVRYGVQLFDHFQLGPAYWFSCGDEITGHALLLVEEGPKTHYLYDVFWNNRLVDANGNPKNYWDALVELLRHDNSDVFIEELPYELGRRPSLETPEGWSGPGSEYGISIFETENHPFTFRQSVRCSGIDSIPMVLYQREPIDKSLEWPIVPGVDDRNMLEWIEGDHNFPPRLEYFYIIGVEIRGAPHLQARYDSIVYNHWLYADSY